jgi:hypothetical protein
LEGAQRIIAKAREIKRQPGPVTLGKRLSGSILKHLVAQAANHRDCNQANFLE